MRPRDQHDQLADAMRRDEGQEAAAVLVVVHVPSSFRGLSFAEVRRKLDHPVNSAATLDSIAHAVVEYFNDPASAARLYENMQTAAKRAAHGEGP